MTILGKSAITAITCSVTLKGVDAAGNALQTQFNEPIRLN